MFIGHLPAGYCLTRILQIRFDGGNRQAHGLYLWIGLICSVLPDLDLVYFYLIDHRQHAHHSYWTHTPFYWICTALVFLAGTIGTKRPVFIRATIIGILNIITHLLLDSIASKIRWLSPISDDGFGLFSVPSRYGWWVWNYLCHWTFTFEVMLVIMAACMVYYHPSDYRGYNDHKEMCTYAGDCIDRGR